MDMLIVGRRQREHQLALDLYRVGKGTVEGDFALRKAIALLPHQLQEFDVTPKYSELQPNISSLLVSPDGHLLAIGTQVWDASTGVVLCKWSEEGRVASVTFSPDQIHLAVGRLNGKVSLIDLTKKCSAEQLVKLQTVGEIVFSSDGHYLAFSEGIPPRDGWFIYSGGTIDGKESTIVIWDVRSAKELRKLSHNGWVNSIDFHRNNEWLVSGSDDKTVRVWDVPSGKELYHATHSERVNLVRFSPDSTSVAFADSCFGKGVVENCHPSMLKVWDFEMGKFRWEVQLNAAWVSSLAFSPNGQFVFSVNNYSTTGCETRLANCTNLVQVWDVTSGREITRMDHGFDVIIAFAVSSDGKWVASGGADGAVRVWDPLTGRESHRVPYNEPWTVAFSPDDQWIAVGGYDNSAIFARSFPLDQGRLIEIACSRLDRNLTLAEWHQYIGSGTRYHITCDPNVFPKAVIPEDAQAYLNGQ